MPNRNKIAITILVCDDDAEDRDLIEAALREAHVENPIKFVEDGEQLLDYLYQRGAYAGETGAAPRPGLILLDLNMPKLDGREALKRIKEDKSLRDIPVVVLTSSQLEEDAIRSHQLGVKAFIAKPVTFAGLVEAMNALGSYWIKIVEPPPAVA